jgi:SulP family sulfate permease
MDLEAKNISLKVTEDRAEVRDNLRASDMEVLLGHISRSVSVADLVADLVAEAVNSNLGMPPTKENG